MRTHLKVLWQVGFSLISSSFAQGVNASFAAPPHVSDSTMKAWRTGLAEISVYNGKEERYGVLRPAQTVMVFVTEDVNAQTRVKIESDKTSEKNRIPVLKLNRILKFSTGIYDYSVMTSVFTAMENAVWTKRILEPVKISLSSQEWCGQVYHHILPGPNSIEESLHSYFESEGDVARKIPAPKGSSLYEDELPIYLRQLNGATLAAGFQQSFSIVPSLWRLRKIHRSLEISPGILRRLPDSLGFKAGDSKVTAEVYALDWNGKTSLYFIESQGKRRLLGWKDDFGSQFTLSKTTYKSYWSKNKAEDSGLRQELGLRYGVDEAAKGAAAK